MENNKDYEKRLGRRLREAYLKDYEGPAMSRENFHRLIEAAEKKKNHNKAMIGLAAACVALCLVCGDFVAGISMRESASAGKDDETKTVQQGGSVIIGSGVSEDDQNVGVSTKTYTDIKDIPEDLREQIHFLDSDEFELEKVKVMEGTQVDVISLFYKDVDGCTIKVNEQLFDDKQKISIIKEFDIAGNYEGTTIYERQDKSEIYYTFFDEEIVYNITLTEESKNKIEAIICGLY